MLRLIFFTTVAGLLLGAAGCVVNPVTGESQFSLLSQSDEVSIGTRQMQEWIQANEGLYPDAHLQRYVQGIGQRIASASQRPALPYQFAVINSSDLNASTLPGGKTLINRGLLAKLKNEDQLAALIAHEVGHTAAMHIATQATQQSLGGLLLGGLQWGLSKGGVEGADYYLQGAGFGTQLFLLKFSRDMERQADALGMDYLVWAGYNPQAMMELMRLLQQNDRSGLAISFLQTHPLHKDRLSDIAAKLDTLPPDIRIRPYRIREFQQATRGLTQMSQAFAWETSAKAAIKRRDFAGAIHDLERAIQIFPGYAPFYAHLAFVQLKAGRFYQAQQTARRAQSLAPDLFLAQSVAGIVHYAARDYPESLSALGLADRIVPGVRAIRFYMAECYLKLRDYRRATVLYADIAEKSPESPEGQVALQRLQQLGVTR